MRKAPKGRRTEQDVHGQDSGRDGQKSQLHGQERWSQESSPPWKKIDRKATSALAWFYCFNSWFYKNPPGGMHSWGKFWTKDTKRPKSQLALLKSLEQKQDVESKSWVLGMPPALKATGGATSASPPALDTPIPSLHIRKNLATPTLLPLGGVSKWARETAVCLRSSLLQQEPQ